MAKRITPRASSNTIVKNKKAFHEYFIEENIEAGIVLDGWEVKSIRAGRMQIVDSYVHIKSDEAWLFNSHIRPLHCTSTHSLPVADRTRKLLLHTYQIHNLIGKIEQKSYAIIPTSVYWKNSHIKIYLAIAKGKKLHDKRQSSKEQDWQRERARLLKALG